MNKCSETFRQRRHDATAEVLIRAAEIVLGREGYERVTMRDIAAEAGCVPGTLYLYFRNKQSVVDAIAARHSQVVLHRFQEALASVADPLEKLAAITRVLVTYVHSNRASYRIIRSVMRARSVSFPDSLPAAIRGEWNAFFKVEAEIIRQAQKRKQIRADVKPEVLLQFMQVCTSGLLDEWSSGERPPDAAPPVEQIWGFLTCGMGGKP
jgi:AcrR family transcriptional regulator